MENNTETPIENTVTITLKEMGPRAISIQLGSEPEVPAGTRLGDLSAIHQLGAMGLKYLMAELATVGKQVKLEDLQN